MAKPNLRLPFLKKYRDRHGKMRHYHRPTGTPLPGKPGSAEFMLAYHTACARGTDVDKPRNLAKSVTVE